MSIQSGLLLVLLLAAWPVCAEELEPTPSSVKFLPLDDEVKDQIAAIDKLVGQQSWREAIEICQKLIVSPSKSVAEIRPGVYAGVRALCEKKLDAMPDQAKLLYRTLYDPAAERLYKQALKERDAGAAQALVSQFLVTSHGLNGLSLLGELLFERGDPYGALDAWSRWMDRVNAETLPESERRVTAVKAAVAAAKVGDSQAVERAIRLFGPKGTAVDAGAAKLTRSEELRQLVAGLWSSVAVAPDAAPKDLRFKRWGATFESGYATHVSRIYGNAPRVSSGSYSCLLNGTLYVNTPDGPIAHEVLTGRLLWKRVARNYDSDYYESLRSTSFHCRAYPVPGGDKVIAFVSGGSRLEAYDGESGRSLWAKQRTSFAAVEGIGNDPNLRVAFSSPVASSGRTAYVILETTRGEVYLLALDRADGAVRWSRSIGASAAQSGYRISVPSDLIVVGSSVVFCNGHGLIGRCDAQTGEIKWLVPYRRRGRVIREGVDLSLAFPYSPMAQRGDCAFVLPSDGHELLAVRLSDGSIQWKKELPDAGRFLGSLGPTDGSAHDRLFVSGGDMLRCLRADDGATLWTWPVPEPSPGGCSGRVGGTGLIVGTGRALYVLDAKSGELVSSRPLGSQNRGEASVAFDRDTVALVSSNLITVLSDPGRTRELLDQAAPGPWVSATRARLLRNDGKQEAALKCLAEAVAEAKKSPDAKKVAELLESEIVDVYHDLYATAWKAGRSVEALQWMLRALQSPGDVPYECKLGYRRESARDASEAHSLVLASGDVLSGRLTAMDWGLVTFQVRGEPWQIAEPGIRRIVLVPGVRPAESEMVNGPHVVLLNGDRISCRVESLGPDGLRVRAGFGDFVLRLADVSVITFGGGGEKAPARGVYVRFRNGDQVSGEMAAFDGSEFVLDVPFCGKRRIPASQIYTISNRRAMPAATPAREVLDPEGDWDGPQERQVDF